MERPAVQKGLDVPERNWVRETLADPEKVWRVIVDFLVPNVTGQRDFGRLEQGGVGERLGQTDLISGPCHFLLLQCTTRPW